ncbi:adenylyl-sulfate kinase [Paraburkholderia acidisoli]|uniref:Adenylyl-sulfate kinase n=1 Tax=Paraburkholderia acidisoli TaxID=2571748 RepID=A0A7Z2GFF1_9BURK|nr:adenylyl-sulfate kinase [Paraburkholderia acidisoli]QGZ60806.1 adenylyl-sulfate kinase [Paraburkholderia acidisoli]
MEMRTGVVVWMTGMSGAGKSTIARELVVKLQNEGVRAIALDGDVLRAGLNSDLGFSAADRSENLRRVAHVAALFCDEGYAVITATISPEPEHRQNARRIAGSKRFIEVFVDTPLFICESRDPKGLYKRARGGSIAGFTGIDSPYRAPTNPDIVLRTADRSAEECVQQLYAALPLQRCLAQVERSPC